MTFDEARKKQIMELDKVFAELREVAIDPTWTNHAYIKFKDANTKLNNVFACILRLNLAELEAK